MTLPTFDITLPVLNEELRLRGGVEMLERYLSAHHLMERCFITIADNGSTDGTRELAAQLAREYANLSFVSVGQRGVGRALKSSWGQARADIVGYMDVDMATDLAHFARVVEAFNDPHVSVVNGSRNLPGSKVINRSLARDISSWSFNKLLQMILGVKFSDGMCGFKFLRRSTYGAISRVGIRNDGWFFCTEILCLAERLGYAVTEIPVHWTDDRNSRVKMVRLSLYYLREMFHLRHRHIKVGL